MTRRDALKFSLTPFVLLVVALFIIHITDKLIIEVDADQPKLTKLIKGIESGDIHPTKDQLVAYFKSSREVERSRASHNERMRSFLHSMARLLAILGLIQLGLVFYCYRKKRL